jgi:hypothetical protein
MEKINYKDFTVQKKFLGLSKTPFDSVIEEANEWISINKIRALNVETLKDFKISQGKTTSEMIGVRVWYKM